MRTKVLIGWNPVEDFKYQLPQLLGWLLLKKLDFSILEKCEKSRDDMFQECRILRR